MMANPTPIPSSPPSLMPTSILSSCCLPAHESIQRHPQRALRTLPHSQLLHSLLHSLTSTEPVCAYTAAQSMAALIRCEEHEAWKLGLMLRRIMAANSGKEQSHENDADSQSPVSDGSDATCRIVRPAGFTALHLLPVFIQLLADLTPAADMDIDMAGQMSGSTKSDGNVNVRKRLGAGVIEHSEAVMQCIPELFSVASKLSVDDSMMSWAPATLFHYMADLTQAIEQDATDECKKNWMMMTVAPLISYMTCLIFSSESLSWCRLINSWCDLLLHQFPSRCSSPACLSTSSSSSSSSSPTATTTYTTPIPIPEFATQLIPILTLAMEKLHAHSIQVMDERGDGKSADDDSDSRQTDENEEEKAEGRRALWLLVSSLWHVLLSHEDMHSCTRVDVSAQVVQALKHLQQCMEMGRKTIASFQSNFIELMSDEDDQLIDSLLHWAHVSERLAILQRHDHVAAPSIVAAHLSSSVPPSIIEALDPLSFFIRFLYLLSFDHQVLLDWLLHLDETRFLAYFTHTLKTIVRGGMESMQHLKLCANQIQKEIKANDVEEEEDDVEMESNDDDDLCQRVMDCLIRLRLAVRRLHDKSLFPYPIGPLLSLLSSVETLYEASCNDSESSDG